jgi:outer membrane protein assembly factor BamA
VDVRFDITEGPQAIVDHILVVGNVKTDSRVIEREVQLKTGQPLGLDALFETRRRLGALGLFRRIRIDQIQHGESSRHDIIIHVEEAPSTTIGYGGGLELGQVLVSGTAGATEGDYELAPRGFFEIGRRNIGGKNRSANLYTRLSLRSDRNNATDSGARFSFPEYRVVGTFREPRTFGWNADVTMTGAIEQGVRSTFKFSRKGVNAEMLRRLSAPAPSTRRSPNGSRRRSTACSRRYGSQALRRPSRVTRETMRWTRRTDGSSAVREASPRAPWAGRSGSSSRSSRRRHTGWYRWADA